MAKYLVSTKELYRVDDEVEVEDMLELAKRDSTYDLKGYTCKKKETKEDEYYLLTLEKVFTSEKEPMYRYEPHYTTAGVEF